MTVSDSGSTLFEDDWEGFVNRNFTLAITAGFACLKQTGEQAVKETPDRGVWLLRPSSPPLPAQHIPSESRAGAAP